MVNSKLGELDITDTVLFLLLEKGNAIDTSTLKSEVRDFLEPSGPNLLPLENRNDEVIDQIMRNIVSHRHESSNNIINRGYVQYNNGYLSITDSGRNYLRNRIKDRFTRELN